MDHIADIDQTAVEAWERKERSVTLTNAEWTKIITYILMTTKSRQGEAEAWEKLATEKKDDGTPRYMNAAKNAEYWRELDATLEKIRQKLEP